MARLSFFLAVLFPLPVFLFVYLPARSTSVLYTSLVGIVWHKYLPPQECNCRSGSKDVWHQHPDTVECARCVFLRQRNGRLLLHPMSSRPCWCSIVLNHCEQRLIRDERPH